MEEVTSKLVGRAEMQKGLDPLTRAVAEVLEGYLHCGHSSIRSVGSRPKAGLYNQALRQESAHITSGCENQHRFFPQVEM